MTFTFLVQQFINGLAYSSLLYLLSIGFTLIFGLMRIVNLTHGSFYLMGAYVGLFVIRTTGSFELALPAAAISVAIVGMVMERGLLRRFHGKDMDQVLLTMALWFIFDDIMLVLSGGYPYRIAPPSWLAGPIILGAVAFPMYRAAMIIAGILVAIGIWLVIERTKLGAIVRAGADNELIARAMGLNVNRAFVFAFALGSFLAGLAGILGGPMMGAESVLSGTMLPLAMVVVIVGGMGSTSGALAGSLFVGLMDNFGRALFPDFSYFTLFVPMALILAFRPQGLFGRA